MSKIDKHSCQWFNDRYNNTISCYDPSCRKKAGFTTRRKIRRCPKFHSRKYKTYSHQWIYNDDETWWTRRCGRCSFHQI